MAKYNLTDNQKQCLKVLCEYSRNWNGGEFEWDGGMLSLLHDKGDFIETPARCTRSDLLHFEKSELITPSGSQTTSVRFGVTQKALDAEANDFKDDEEQTTSAPAPRVPLGITESLAKFRKDYPDPRKCCFVMMKFGSTPAHSTIIETLRTELRRYGIEALRADDKEYNDSLYDNVMTYIYGCGFGVAVFERLTSDDFNPNVSLEVGYMLALGKPVCFMKDKTLPTLQTDLVGKLYRSFDPQQIAISMPSELKKWLDDKELLR